ncbi:MAG: DsbA family protein [Gammaproteobacteria bacterium]|nr:DsbA family protein [Gammaproteobacteria bacterium]
MNADANTLSGAQLEFYFSPGSRYSYLALSQVPKLEATFDVRFEWIVVTGTTVRSLRGADPFQGPPLSGQYDWSYRQADAEAWADYYGIPFVEPAEHSFDADLLGRGAIAANSFGCLREVAWALAREVYEHASWPLDEEVVLATAESLGLERSAFAKRLSAQETIAAMATNCQRAVDRGAFGTPTFFVNERLFWGNDRIPLLHHALDQLKLS